MRRDREAFVRGEESVSAWDGGFVGDGGFEGLDEHELIPSPRAAPAPAPPSARRRRRVMSLSVMAGP
ncbi:hypothetical protein ABZ656_01690 [Streptomyces sp. NPDC007095]|uniref:hypothetical protein n=1 Tax=Streptomyces sp. NPDC007095 TaxID=3154482 RepID=UPI003400BD2E